MDVIVVGFSTGDDEPFLPAVHALERAGTIRVAGIVDTDAHARAYFLQHFPDARSADSLDAVVVPPGGLAIVASAPRFHPGHATAALRRGWHVLCKTPLATNAREAAAMIAAAQRHERLLAVDLHKRFFPAARYIRTLCCDHLLGPIFSLAVHEGRPRSTTASPLVPAKAAAPEGVLSELGVHALDLLTWFLGSPSVLNYSDDAMGGVEANAFLELAFPENVRGIVHLSRDWPTSQSYTFVFERGIVRWRVDEANKLTLQLASSPAALSAELVQPISPHDPDTPTNGPLFSGAESFGAQLQNVVAAISQREPLRIPATEAMHALPIVEECYARRTLLDQPWLTRNETAHARALSVPLGSRL